VSHPIEAAITRLVQEAPALDPAQVRALVAALDEHGAPLARSIARVLEHVAPGIAPEGREAVRPSGRASGPSIDAGVALPALAMACATLCDARLGEREREAARNEIETLLPLPASATRAPKLAAPDVPLTALKRR